MSHGLCDYLKRAGVIKSPTVWGWGKGWVRGCQKLKRRNLWTTPKEDHRDNHTIQFFW